MDQEEKSSFAEMQDLPVFDFLAPVECVDTEKMCVAKEQIVLLIRGKRRM